MRHYPAADPKAPTLVLAHGAGAGDDHPWMIRVAGGLAARGVHVVTFNFPYKEAGRKLPDRGPVLEAAFLEVWAAVAREARGPVFAGGKSMGGRIASHVASRGGFTPAPAGLVFLGYPLHPPRLPAVRRDGHLPAIHGPMLFVQGTRDGFGSPEEMRALVATLPSASLKLIDGGDHSLLAPRKQDPDGVSLDTAIVTVADWILAIAASPARPPQRP
jgi:uncharacterized protein